MTATKISKKNITVMSPPKAMTVDKEKYHQKRVAAYCRVSTDSEEQLTSYTTQKKVYTEMIAARPDWELAGIYADEGISGTRADKRPQFQKMIKDCFAGKIDYIVTKSVSRFARNTVDCLEHVRILKNRGIGIFFEEQNIDTLSIDSELYLVIYAGFAQSESESMSKNITWAYRKRFEDGKVLMQYKSMLGYRDAGEVESYAEFEQLWVSEFPDETEWHHFTAVEDPLTGFRAVTLDHRLVLEVDPHQQPNPMHDLSKFTGWLVEAVEEVILEIKAGEYLRHLERELPLKHRTGTIQRCDTWRVFPEWRNEFLEDLAPSDVKEFLDEAVEVLPEQKPLLPEMTASDFYMFCSLGYRAMKYEGSDLSPKEQYYKHADGRDEGLKSINPESAAEFSVWYEERPMIGHPWEVCRGGNSTHIDLYVCKADGGYYLMVAGASESRTVEAIKFYLALHRAGLPVCMRKANALKNRLTGKEMIGIVPTGVAPFYCHHYFPGQDIIAFMNLPTERSEPFANYCNWQKISVSNLKR